MKFLTLVSFSSLQGRHLIATVVLTFAVLAAVSSVFFSVQETRNKAANNLESRGELLANNRHIHEALWQGHIDLDRFLLDPNKSQYAIKSLESFKKAGQHTHFLLEHPWLVGQSQLMNLSHLPAVFTELLSSINQLIISRKDPAAQYPALAISNEALNPNRKIFINAMSVLINEATSGDKTPHFTELYAEIIQARYLWSQMISNFRSYMTNQLGVFSEETLRTQEESIELLFADLSQQLDKLNNFKQTDKLEFDDRNSLSALYTSSKNWFISYLDIKTGYQDENWRTDINLLRNTIEPRLDEIQGLLLNFDLMLEQSMSMDIEDLDTSANKQENLLWGISSIIIFIALVSLLSMQRFIFRPIALVTQALNEEAAGETGIIMPSALTTETRKLVDAFSEMRAQIHSRQIALEKISLYDNLTGLPNRSLFLDRIEQEIPQNSDTNNVIALIAIEIRRLKEINDTLGHNVSDRILIEVSQRLQSLADQHITISRTGSDQFGILLKDSTEIEAIEFSERIYHALSEKHHVQQLTIDISPIMGIATYPAHAKNHSQLYQRAEIAKHMAKKSMRKVLTYTVEKDEYHRERLNLMGDLKEAIKSNQLELHYQPKLDLNNNQIVGVEALLRWNHPDFGWVDAEEAIIIAEQSGFIDQLSYWTLKTGIAQCAKWRENHIDLSIAINLSVHTLQNSNFAIFIRDTLSEFQLPPKYLVLEITESAMMTNPLQASGIAMQLSQIGVILSADDFGTGFSSFTYLKHIPVNEIKIDKSFIMNMVNDKTDTAIVKSAINLAQSLGLNVIAEGIETDDTRLMLKQLNCHFGQGYLFSKPLTAKALIKWLNTQTPLETAS